MSKTRTIEALTFNVMQPVNPPIRYYGQEERSKRVKDVVSRYNLKTLDALVLNEVITDQSQKIILKDMSDLGLTNQTKNLDHFLHPVPGGVFICSQYPIEETDSVRFGNSCSGSDCFSSKGVVYAKVGKPESTFHIFATHMQAWPGLEREHIRTAQLSILKAFVQSKQIPFDEPVIIMGDMNMDMYKERNQLDFALSLLQFGLPDIANDSETFTVDTQGNPLVGADDPAMYKNHKYPEGCVSEYFQTLNCPCCDNAWIDYCLYSRNHVLPIETSMSSDNHRVDSFKISLNQATTITHVETVSDHSPVFAKLTYPPIGTTEKQDNEEEEEVLMLDKLTSDSFVHMMATCIGIALLALFTWLVVVAKESKKARIALGVLGALAATGTIVVLGRSSS